VIGAIVDAGPLVAFCDRRDQRHGWTVKAFKAVAGPMVTCEAVLAEALFLVRHRADMQDALLAMVSRRQLTIPFHLEEEVEAVRELRRRYADVPMSLADACLVRLAEVCAGRHVCTFDSDFSIYRRNARDPIPLLTPERRL
jgi:uncharacterized protein